MNCIICGTVRREGDSCCPNCGHPYPDPAPEPPVVSYSPSNPPKKRHGLLIVVLSVLLALVFLSGLSLTVVQLLRGADSVPSGSSTSVSEACFRLEDGVLTFLPEKFNGGRVLVVPDSIDGQAVTAIGTGCFAGCAELTTIYLPEGIQTIYPNAFDGCTNLRGLYLPESTVYIGPKAFAGCINLEAIYIPIGINTISRGVFDDCASLRYIFYSGFYEEWNNIYPHFITPFTYVICSDGEYYHGTGLG